MAQWVVSKKPRSIFDPAVGLGHLLQACHSLDPKAELAGLDADRKMIKAASHAIPTATNLSWGDYLQHNCIPFDGIIANPPFIRSRRLRYSELAWQNFEQKFGLSLRRTTNLYALFLLKIWHDLAMGGRAAVLVPAEFLNANFGVALKGWLLNVVRPTGLIVFSPNQALFEGVLTTACILFLEKGRAAAQPIHCQLAKNPEEARRFVKDLLAAPEKITKPKGAFDISALKPEDKWLGQILSHGRAGYPRLPRRVGDYFRCRRGIATGANHYFCLSLDQLSDLRLKRSHFEPCLTKASSIEGLIFTRADFEKLIQQNAKCLLLNPQRPDPALAVYLRKGKTSGIDGRYLPRHRPVWYLPERSQPADVLISTFSRNGLKCVLNEAKIRTLTCMHGLYSQSASRAEAILLVIYLNSIFAAAPCQSVQRVFGNGFQKLEPKDVEAIPCPEFPTITPRAADHLARKLKRIDLLPQPKRQIAIDALAKSLFSIPSA